MTSQPHMCSPLPASLISPTFLHSLRHLACRAVPKRSLAEEVVFPSAADFHHPVPKVFSGYWFCTRRGGLRGGPDPPRGGQPPPPGWGGPALTSNTSSSVLCARKLMVLSMSTFVRLLEKNYLKTENLFYEPPSKIPALRTWEFGVSRTPPPLT